MSEVFAVRGAQVTHPLTARKDIIRRFEEASVLPNGSQDSSFEHHRCSFYSSNTSLRDLIGFWMRSIRVVPGAQTL